MSTDSKLQPKSHRIVAIGEVLWDVFDSGPRFGGAPANFACSCAGLAGARASVEMISAVGPDPLGDDALAALRDHHVGTSHVARSEHPTGKVTVSLDEGGKASYEFATDCAWDNRYWSDELSEVARSADAVCFGTLGQRSDVSRQTIKRFVALVPETSLRVFDINLRPPFYSDDVILESAELANVLKLNEDELPILANLCGMSGDDASLLTQLTERFSLRAIALTRGEKGALLWREGQLSDFAGVRTHVVDTVGAGDAFTAAFVLGLLEQIDLDIVNEQACQVAAFVCTQPGATPNMPPDLAAKLFRS